MNNRFVELPTLLAILVAAIIVVCSNSSNIANSEQIQISSVLPKLQAIHEDTKNLLLKNSELKAKIQAGAKQHQSSPNQQRKNIRTSTQTTSGDQQKKTQRPLPGLTVSSAPKPAAGTLGRSTNGAIDYLELEDFNGWVDSNLEYAVANTRASIEALKEEAQQNNGTIEYSEQAVQDGIEGVRYWQQAVIFQDKTLKNEKFDVED